jgi:hypothetical protein
MKPNGWLSDNKFLQNVEFYDKYYFQSLCLYIDNFIKNVPVPCITTWDYKHEQIYFSVGQESKPFKVDINIAYRDYITLVKRWLQQFYPRYEIGVEREISLPDEEIWEKVKKDGIKLDDALLITKKIKEKEIGIIEKVFFIEDKFILNINNNRFLMISGTEDSICPISTFLPTLRNIENDIEKKKYIIKNSKELKLLEKKEEIIEINYPGFQMKNFVEINYIDLKDKEFKKIDTRKWQWKNYILNMETNILESDILEFLRNKNHKIDIGEE